MIRLLHIIAISALIASAGYAYSIKYETLYYVEQVAKLKAQVQRERERRAVRSRAASALQGALPCGSRWRPDSVREGVRV